MAIAAELLKTELQAYERHKPDLLRAGEGKYVLIHGEQIAGTFYSQLDAINEGYRRFGLSPFLVKKIIPVDMPITIYRHRIGS